MTKSNNLGAGAANPVLVEVTRGSRLESVHRGAVCVANVDADVEFALGDIEVPIFPRSAIKPLQALPLVETGAAAAFGFGDEELALAQASHGGEPDHVRVATAMLAAIGLDETALECGIHSPSHRPSSIALRKGGSAPNQLHNNCSGKHAGFLATARHLGMDPDGYVKPEHPVQAIIRGTLSDLMDIPLRADDAAVDGCTVPTYPTPLRSLALAFARFGTGQAMEKARAQAAQQLFAAVTNRPFYIAGTGRFCTEVVDRLPGQILIKSGGEGTYCGAIPGRGLGIAVKCDDGNGRGAESMMAAIIARLFPDAAEDLAGRLAVQVNSVKNMPVGVIQPVAAAFADLN